MKKKKLWKRSLAVLMSLAVTGTTVLSGWGEGVLTAKAAGTAMGKGTIATEVTGSYSWDSGSATNASLLAKLPTIANKGTHRFTTDNYDANNKAIDTSNWGTSMMWNVNGGNAYGDSVYAIPWSFKADQTRQGMMITKPITNYSQATNGTETGSWMMSMAEDGSTSEFVIKPGYTTNGVKVDKITDWTYDVVMQNASDTSQYMKTTMVQGSPFAYFEMVGTNTMSVERPRSLNSVVAAYNGTAIENSTMLIVRVFDNHDQTRTGNQYDYYAFYVPEGTTWNIVTADAEHITSMTANFPANKTYFSVAILTELPDVDDNAALEIANLYKPYAYNFVTDTRAEYSYNESTQKLTTTFTYTVDKKAESTAEGTIMGILPHQYKNMSGYTYLAPTIGTIRGTMKLLAGSSFTTELTYTGVLPWLAGVEDTTQLGNYVDEYMDKYFPNGVAKDPFAVQYQGNDTYGTGKGLNRTSNVIAAAEAAGKTEDANLLLNALEDELEDWFTASGTDGDKYFYYDENVGSLFGFPQSYSSVDQMNDHHFHYGYFIYAAAQVALRDPEWASDSNWGLMVKELINDIACTERNSSTSRYPYMRNFAAYEGHSWASGHSNFADGNNHESSSEAMNAWAGIILFGEAIGDTELRDLGIYLYTTEISAINNYWFDVDEDVLDDNYRYMGQTNVTEDSLPTYNQAAQVWGGKMDYATWWTAEPLQVQGINLLPINPSSFYMAGNKDYILENWQIALERESRITADRLGDTYEEYTKRWNDVWSAYIALADPEEAINYWQTTADEEGGESRAHTYQYIYSLKEHGTPDISITSNCATSAVFDKDGVKTYVVYNAASAAKEVTFSDGIKVNAAPKTMTSLKATDIEGVSTYTVEYYKENLAGNGYDKETVIKSGMDGDTVNAEQKTFAGYSFDSTNGNNVSSGIIKSDDSLTLKLYYKRDTYTVNYELNGGTLDTANPSSYRFGQELSLNSPTKTDCEFLGWYKESSFKNKLEGITASTSGNLTLYAKWKDLTVTEAEEGKSAKYEGDSIIFSVTGESGLKRATVYYQIFDSEAEAQERAKDVGVGGTVGINLTDNGGDNWSTTVSLPNAAGKFILFKYNVEGSTGARDTAWGIHEIQAVSATAVNYKTEYYKENASGGYDLAETVTKKGEPEDTVNAVEKTYTGYTLDKNITGTLASGTVGAADSLTLKLYYKRNSYTITYTLNGGTNDGSNPTSYKYGDSITLKNPTREGYTFGGWYENASFTGSKVTAISATSAENLDLYAKWTEGTGGEGGDDKNTGGYEFMTGRTLSYKDGNLTVSVSSDDTITFAEIFFKVYETKSEADAVNDLATLGGSHLLKDDGSGTWTYTESLPGQEGKYIVFFCNAIINGAGTPLAFNVYQLPGSEEPVTAAYKVEHYLQNEAKNNYILKDTENLTGTVDETVSASRKSYTGFTCDPSAAGTLTSGTVTEDGKLTLKLYYTRDSYSISYTLNDGTQNAANPSSYTYGVGVPTLQAPTRDGYTFAGWYENASLTGSKVTTISTDRTGNITLYASWTKNGTGEDPEPETHTGRGVEYKDGKLTFYVADPAEGVNGAKAYYKIYASEDEALAASGSADISDMKPVELTYDETAGCYTASVDEEMTEDSYLLYTFYFEGGEEAGTGDWNVISREIMTSGQVSVVRYYVEHYQQNVAKNDYIRMGEETRTGIAGASVTATARSYTGFTYNPAAAEAKVSGTVAEDGALILKLYYDRDEYPIQYNLNGGIQNAANPSSYVYGVGVAELKTPTRSGYTFDGWYTAADFTGSRIAGITGAQTGAVSVYAKWTQNTVTPPTDTNPVKVDAKAPAISKNPAGKTYSYKAKATVTVTASSIDGGTLSYQWYKNTKNSTTGATMIKGATKASYTVPTTKLGTTYYFCQVTNTNSQATGTKTAAVTSKTAKVVVTKAANPITKVSKYSKAIGSKLTLKPAGTATYKSSNKKVVTVTKKGKVTFKGFGTATITVKAKGNSYYKAATKKIKFTVTPKTAAISSVKSAKSKTATVKWKKDTKATGYQIQYSTSSSFKKAKTTTVKKSSTTTATLKKLTGGKKYYVRVREYKKVGKTTIYGSWSKTKTVKVKK